MKLPVIPLAILGGQIAASYYPGDMKATLNSFQAKYTGYDFNNHVFYPNLLVEGYGPWVAYGLVKKFVFPFANPNRALSRMHIPVSL